MSTTLDDVIETVLRAREDGPEALAAMALSFGATMALGTLRIHALRGQIAELRAAQTAADEMVATLRHERDAALAECKAARQSVDEAKADAARLRALVESAADTAEVWRLRESVAALRADRARAVAERDRAVQEREAFSLRLSAAERERDEARAALDLARESAREARAALDLARESAREARAEIAQSLALVDEARAALDAALARPTYEARTTMPTPDERGAHLRHGARWLRATPHHVSITHLHRTESVEHLDGATWLPLGADGLPCAWPVAGEVSL